MTPTTGIMLKTHSTPRTTSQTSWPSTSTDVKCRQNHCSQTGSYIRSYVNLFSATGKHARDEGDDFDNGYTFFGFDLTPDACDGGCFHLVRNGNLRIEIHFAEALVQTVNVVVYGEFEAVLEAVLEVDKGRNVIYSY